MRKVDVFWRSAAKKEYLVGEIIEDDTGGKETFYFSYISMVEEAIKEGFNLIIPFDHIHKVYISDILFGVFSSRLPDKKRRDIDKILKKYELSEYDELDLLVRTSGRLPIDNLYFRANEKSH